MYRLIKKGAVVNAMDYHGTTALHLACQRGHDSAAVSSKYFLAIISSGLRNVNQWHEIARTIKVTENSSDL